MSKKYWDVCTVDGCADKVVLAYNFEGTYEEVIEKYAKKAYVRLDVWEVDKPKIKPAVHTCHEARNVTICVHGFYMIIATNHYF